MTGKKVRWRARAPADLRAIYDWLETIEGAQPAKTIGRIRAAAESMNRLGDIGRPGLAPGVRELLVPSAPYVVVDQTEDDGISILAVYHTAQDR